MEISRKTERLLKAFANQRRLAILAFLKTNGRTPVGQIADAIRLSFTATSRHLRLLELMDIVQKEQRGLEVYYSIAGEQKSLSKSILGHF